MVSSFELKPDICRWYYSDENKFWIKFREGDITLEKDDHFLYLSVIGIYKKYRRRGHLKIIISILEDIANNICIKNVINPILEEYLEKNGYKKEVLSNNIINYHKHIK